MKLKLMAAAAAGLFASAAQAQPGFGPGPGYGYGMGPGAQGDPRYYYPARRSQADQQVMQAAQTLKQGMEKLLGFLSQPQQPDAQALGGFLEKEIAPYFDFDYMAEWVGGPMSRQMDDKQRAEMADKLAQHFLATMTQSLSRYDRQAVRYLPPRRGAKENEATVSVAILNPRGYPSRLDFRMYKSGDDWKVFDVRANGNSALVFYRRYFANQLRQQRMMRVRQMRAGSGMGGPGPMGYPAGMPPR